MLFLFLLAAIPLDPVGDPLPRYLTTGSVRAQLQQLMPALQACGVREEHTEPVTFSLLGNGTATNVEWSQEASDAQQCWERAMTSHQYSTHDDVAVRVATTVYVRDGLLSLSPQVNVSSRELGPLMLFVLPEFVTEIENRLYKGHEPNREP